MFSVVTLALGIGVATAAYSVIYTGLWRPLGLADEDRLAIISRSNMMRPGPTQMSWADYQHLVREQRTLSSVAAWSSWGNVLAGQGTAELVDIELVTGDYFKTLGVSAARGRAIGPDDDRPDAPLVVVLSDATWHDQFQGDPAVVGKTVKLADRPVEVVGVAAPGFRGVNPQAFVTRAGWMAMATAPHVDGQLRQAFEPRNTWSLFYAIGRLKPDHTWHEAEADVIDIGERLDTAAPRRPYQNTPTSAPIPISRHWTTGLVRDAEQLSATASETGRLIVVLPALVLLIACTNLANLVLSRGVSRQHDFAVRRALGASRWRLIREQLVEQGAIAVLGGAAGLVVAQTLVRYTADVARETMAPFIRSARINWTLDAGVLQATAVAVLLSLVVSGLVPALHLTRDSLRGMLARDGASTTPRWRGRGNLIALQVGVSVGLFLIAVVFIRMLMTDLPRSTVAGQPVLSRVAVAMIPFGQQQRDEARARETLRRVFEDATLGSGVDAVAVTSSLPFRDVRTGGFRSISVTSIDRPFVPPKQLGRSVFSVTVSPSFFAILDTPIRFGRAFDGRDKQGDAPVVIVNEGLALDVFGVADVEGREMLMRVENRATRAEPRIERVTIVGVVPGGEAVPGLRGTDAVLYTPFARHFEPNLVVLARANAGGAPLSALRDAIRRADPDLAVGYLARADVLAVGPLAFTPYVAGLLTLLALLAMILAMAGLYGVLSHVVARRTREMGIRIALGAERGRIARLVLRDGFRPIVEGLFIGLATATVVRVFMKANLYSVIAPLDPLAFCLAIVLCVAAGVTACYLPARRASQVDPNVALRSL